MTVTGDPVLTAAQMRAAEARAIAAGSGVIELMERAGAGVATWVHRLAAGAPVLILCGPGNNGGDGYVAARCLAERGMAVRVAALADPATAAAAHARSLWTGVVEAFPPANGEGAIVVDALFGTGLTRALQPEVATALDSLTRSSTLSIAVDLPSGVASDEGDMLGLAPSTRFDLTLALGALKPAHVLHPAAQVCGEVRTIDIGLGEGPPAPVRRATALRIADPQPQSHKFDRGMVAVVGGAMQGASELAALAAYRAGAGYVLLLTGGLPHRPHAIVRRGWSGDALADARIGAVVIGPGLGRGDRAREKLDVALASPHPLVIDGDALHLLDPATLRARSAPSILTPHAGEFAALFGAGQGSKIVRTQHAAREADAIVVFKGPDTVIAKPDGATMVVGNGSAWLSTAGTGDVLAGAIGAMLAQGAPSPFDAAVAGTWLHGAASRRLGRCFLADELADALALVR